MTLRSGRPRPTWMTSPTARWLIFPLLALAAFAVLVSLHLSGSSIAAADPQHHGLISGTPRAIRSDEFQLSTPLALGSAVQHFPSHQWIGLTDVDVAATALGVPASDWTEVVKPQDWGYFAFGSAAGLAAAWWWPYLICALGAYALLGLLLRRPLLAAALSTALTLTPYAGWWNGPGLQIGFGCLTAAALLASWRARRTRSAVVLTLAAAYSGACFALALYPPWQVATAWILLAVVAGTYLDTRPPVARALWTTMAAAVTAGLVAGLWALSHRAAIAAQAATLYPGHRISSAGEGTLTQLMTAPLNFWLSGPAGRTLHAGNGPSNLSEAASAWLPLPVLAVVACWAVVRLRVRATNPTDPTIDGAAAHPPHRWTSVALVAAMSLLLAWSLLPLPHIVGSLTELSRVQGARVPMVLSLGGILVLALSTDRSSRPPRWVPGALVVAVAATAWLTVEVRDHLPWTASKAPLLLVVASALVLASVMSALLGGRRTQNIAAVLLALYAFGSWRMINPVEHGVRAVTDSAVGRELNALGIPVGSRVTVFADPSSSFRLVAQVRASGYQSLSGMTPYPNANLMEALAPTQRSRWNNYAQYIWADGPAGSGATITGLHGTKMLLTIDPCAPALLAAAKPVVAVTDHPVTAACLSPIAQITQGKQTLRFFRYPG